MRRRLMDQEPQRIPLEGRGKETLKTMPFRFLSSVAVAVVVTVTVTEVVAGVFSLSSLSRL